MKKTRIIFFVLQIFSGCVMTVLSASADPDGLGLSVRAAGFFVDRKETSVFPQEGEQVFDHGDPTDYEQLMLELINRARFDPAAEAVRLGIGLNDGLAPGTISEDSKPPLAFHPLLIDAARSHSQWMLDTDTFDHIGVDDTEPGDRMAAAGYPFSGSWAWGENIAWGGSTGSIEMEAQARARHDSLFRSSGHRENLCTLIFSEIGVGVVSGLFTDEEDTYNAAMVTQNFADSGGTPGPLVTGVVYQDTNGNGFYDVGEGLSGVAVMVEDGSWVTQTSSSGGYAIPYDILPTMMQVTFSGSPLAVPVTVQTDRTGSNVKVDLEGTAYLSLPWDEGYDDLGGGWRRLAWFGDYVPTSGGWFWHNRHGYFFPTAVSTPDRIYLYTMDMGWLFTRQDRYPYLYRFGDRCWLWYLPDSVSPRWFNNLTEGVWEEW